MVFRLPVRHDGSLPPPPPGHHKRRPRPPTSPFLCNPEPPPATTNAVLAHPRTHFCATLSRPPAIRTPTYSPLGVPSDGKRSQTRRRSASSGATRLATWETRCLFGSWSDWPVARIDSSITTYCSKMSGSASGPKRRYGAWSKSFAKSSGRRAWMIWPRPSTETRPIITA